MENRNDNPVLSVCICVHPWFSFSFSLKTEIEPRMARRGTDEERVMETIFKKGLPAPLHKLSEPNYQVLRKGAEAPFSICVGSVWSGASLSVWGQVLHCNIFDNKPPFTTFSLRKKSIGTRDFPMFSPSVKLILLIIPISPAMISVNTLGIFIEIIPLRSPGISFESIKHGAQYVVKATRSSVKRMDAPSAR